MKIQYASDLHLEFRDNTRYLHDNPLIPVGEVLVLAGDIGCFDDVSYSTHPFWDWAADNFKQTLVIPGNHEFYKSGDLGTIQSGCIAEIRPNVKCYHNTVVTIENVDFILSTLWANIPIENAFITEKNVSDFYRIAYNGRLLTAHLFNQAHQEAVAFLQKSIAAGTAHKRVVVTHHVPSALCMSDEFKTSRINGAFVSELHDFIFDSPIDYWIYGHSHRNIDTMIGNTQCVSNQLGYVSHNEHISFNVKKIIEV
ncbi:metallophosphoesterase [Candidatus Symbiothrix dinenymphae]|uniref:metallophosphoesterase n=1 Tax=Candidatus Symbiothrix dinenymphae TaxID=467085 RepID=UPI0006C61675|nr:metallophosphoesterase [Candidatus Symbiothrix dinenymphae]GAP71814.1 calcineurin-like phosphoesterase [Candidatus Symbiothrix dinenymphae]